MSATGNGATAVVHLPDGGRLHVRETGRGTPLLLLRPLGGTIDAWAPLATALAPHARVVMFDWRGTGRSSAAPWPYGTAGMAGDTAAVLDALGLARADVFGLSLGGMVACRLALDRGARVDRLVLASTPARGLALRLRAAAPALSLAACLLGRRGPAAACLATRVLGPDFRRAHPRTVADVGASAAAHPSSHRDLLALLAAAAAHDVRRDLGRIVHETLVVAGDADRFVPLAAQRRLAAALPRSRLTVLDGAGHDLSVEAPERLAAVVAGHLREGRRDGDG